jgi:chaperonin GroES
MELQPNVGKILVKIETDSQKTSGGIFIPQSAVVDGVRKGKVVAVGPLRVVDGVPTALDFNVNDEVLLDPLGGLKIKLGSEELFLMRMEDVLGKIF